MGVVEELEETIAARGFRITPSRRAILAVIVSQGRQFAVEEVVKQLPGVGRATVFRTVRLLSKLGLLCRVMQEDGHLRYRLADIRRHHHHLVCVRCGRVQDLDHCFLTTMTKEIARVTGYQVERDVLEMYGRCRDCGEAVRPEGGR